MYFKEEVLKKLKYEEISRQNKPIWCCVYLDGKVEHPYWGNVNSCNPVTAEQLSALTWSHINRSPVNTSNFVELGWSLFIVYLNFLLLLIWIHLTTLTSTAVLKFKPHLLNCSISLSTETECILTIFADTLFKDPLNPLSQIEQKDLLRLLSSIKNGQTRNLWTAYMVDRSLG